MNKKILLIDDDEDFCLLVKSILSNVEIMCMSNGTDAIAEISSEVYDCIICDISLPTISGIEVLTQTRDLGINTPFILTSSPEKKYLTKEIYNYSLHGFLEKPISEDILKELVRECFLIGSSVVDPRHMWKEDVDYDSYSLIEVASNLPNIVLIVSVNGDVEFINQYAVKKIGVNGPVRFNDIYKNETIYSFIEKTKNGPIEGVIKNKEIELNVISSCSLLRNKNGKHVGTFIVAKDTTKAEKHKKSLLLFERALMSTHHGVLITDKEGKILWVNPRVEAITGFSSNELVGNNPRILKSNKMKDSFYKKFWETISTGNVWTGIFINKKKNGEFYHERQSITPVLNSVGQIENYIAIKEDISLERKKSKEVDELRAISVTASKLAALGEIAGNIAHQINTPLGTILLKIDNLLEKQNSCEESSSTLNSELSSIKSVVKDISKIITSVKNLYRRGSDKQSIINIKEIIDELHVLSDERFSLMGVVLKSKNEISQNYSFKFNKIELQQVLLNLINNSFDAVKDLEFQDSKWVKLNCFVVNENVVLSVDDSGGGVPEDIAENVFKPFFTTKKETNGTGVGLNLCQKLASKNKSSIELVYQDNKSRFDLIIPVFKNEVPSIDDWEGFKNE